MENFFRFNRPLIEGVVVDHPNRFIMNVKIGEEIFMCHSPTTGKIGSIKMDGRPVLLSESLNPNRKTRYTVEAFSYNRPEDPEKEWIGINQGASNRYVGYFILNGAMPDMISFPENLQSEKTVGHSRLDFVSDNVYLEIKTPIRIIEKKIPEYIEILPKSSAYGGDRLVKHTTELANYAELMKMRAIMLTCFQYRRDPDSPYHYDGGAEDLVEYKDVNPIVNAFERAESAGVESWFVEMSIHPEGVALEKYGRIESKV